MIVLIVLFVILVILLIVGYVIFISVLDQKYYKPNNTDTLPIDDPKKPMYPTHSRLVSFLKPYQQKMKELPFEELEVVSFDHLKLHAYLLKGNPKEVVILAHGYRSKPENDFADKLEIYLKRNSTILLIDERAHSKSEGRYIGFSELEPLDLQIWVNKINELFINPDIYLHGVSMGGASVIHCADKHFKNVKGIIDDCGFDTISKLTRCLIQGMYHVPYFPIGNFAEMFAKLIAKVDFNKTDGEECVRNADVPIVFIHGAEDNFVPCSMSKDLYEACKSPKRLLLVEGAGHAAAYMLAKEEYTNLVNALLDKQIV